MSVAVSVAVVVFIVGAAAGTIVRLIRVASAGGAEPCETTG